MSTTEQLAVLPEVEATLTRLTAHKNVRGVLILARTTGIIIRSAGSLFSSITPPTPSTTTPLTENVTDLTPATTTVSVIALKYAGMAQRMVESLGEEIRDCESGDDLKFLRIRTKKHELMITPDSLYILVVIQDPSI